MGIKLAVMKPKEVLALLETKGFYIARTKGSHILLKHEKHKRLRVTIPMHNKPLKKGTLISIIKQAGIGREGLVKR